MFLESLFEGSRDRSHVKSPMVSSFCPWDPHFLLRTVDKKPFKYIGESVLLTSDITKSILCCSEKILGNLFRDFVFTLAVTLANRRSGSQGRFRGQEGSREGSQGGDKGPLHKGQTRVHKGERPHLQTIKMTTFWPQVHLPRIIRPVRRSPQNSPKTVFLR